MSNPLYSIPGQTQTDAAPAPAGAAAVDRARTVNEVLTQSQVESVLEELGPPVVGKTHLAASLAICGLTDVLKLLRQS